MNDIINDNDSILGSSFLCDRSQAMRMITEAYLDNLDLKDYHAPEEISNINRRVFIDDN